jgi:predicted transcriptional regulator
MRLSKFELQIMDALWSRGALPVRDIRESFAPNGRPAHTTLQTILLRLEKKKAVRRVRKIGNAHIFEALVDRSAVYRSLIDEFLGLFGGRSQPVMMHFIETGKLTLADVKEAEQLLKPRAARSGAEGPPRLIKKSGGRR